MTREDWAGALDTARTTAFVVFSVGSALLAPYIGYALTHGAL